MLWLVFSKTFPENWNSKVPSVVPIFSEGFGFLLPVVVEDVFCIQFKYAKHLLLNRKLSFFIGLGLRMMPFNHE